MATIGKDKPLSAVRINRLHSRDRWAVAHGALTQMARYTGPHPEREMRESFRRNFEELVNVPGNYTTHPGGLLRNSRKDLKLRQRANEAREMIRALDEYDQENMLKHYKKEYKF